MSKLEKAVKDLEKGQRLDFLATDKVPIKNPRTIEWTPELEREIRADEREQFAKSFDFNSLFQNEEEANAWLKYVPIAGAILSFITMLIVIFK